VITHSYYIPDSVPSPTLHHTLPLLSPLFFFNDTATTEIYTLSLHDALPISDSPLGAPQRRPGAQRQPDQRGRPALGAARAGHRRSEEHTSELQSPYDLVCRLLLEKKKQNK